MFPADLRGRDVPLSKVARRRIDRMVLARVFFFPSLAALFCAPILFAQSVPQDLPSAADASCSEAPDEDALVSQCIAPSAPETVVNKAAAENISLPPPVATIHLHIPIGTPLRIAIDRSVRVTRPGELVHGKLVEPVYAFDQEVVPAGSVVTGEIVLVESVSGVKRALAYSNGNFSPFHKYTVTFDSLTLPDGRNLPIKTTVSPGIAEVVHLVSNPDKEKQKSAADRAKEHAKGKIQEAEDEVHDSWQKLMAPGKLHRVKEYLLEQSPYRRQYVEPGTRFVADLEAPLDFGQTQRTSGQLAEVGSAPAPDSTLNARLVAEVSSATASRGTPVTAVLTRPLYSASHQLVLPANTRLVGQVLQAQPARKMHRNGELRVIFERIETPDEAVQALAAVHPAATQTETLDGRRSSQTIVGNLEGVEVDRRSNISLDEEGGARTTDSKTRYLSTGLALLVAAAAAHPDAAHGTVDAGGDPSVRTAAGGSGFRLVGALVGLASKSTPISIALSAYGASSSVYSNFLSRGRDVVLPKDTPVEISFGAPHPAPKLP
jgi:hypothetical protein